VTVGAFAVNTTVGIGGLFEPGRKIGLPRHHSDFGQTLAMAEVPSGPYIVLPVLGPSTVRATTGTAVDFLMRPTTWFLPFATVFYYSGEGVVTLEEHHASVRELERSAVDFYSVLRSAYYQNRIDEVWGRRENRRPNLE
jgi:phospholipid-binding lipoprotein MlaA